MRVTIIVKDKLVTVDGETHICDFNKVPNGLLAVQFYETEGEAEWETTNNTKVDYKFIEPFIKQWKIEKERDDKLKAEEELRQKEFEQRYDVLRRKDYPSFGDQLDALFKAGVFPEEMAAQIQAVKDKYPKPE